MRVYSTVQGGSTILGRRPVDHDLTPGNADDEVEIDLGEPPRFAAAEAHRGRAASPFDLPITSLGYFPTN